MKNQISNFNSPVNHSRHSQVRSSQRGINNQVIHLVIQHGLLIKKQGLNFYIGVKKLFPQSVDHKLAEKASNVLVLVNKSVIVTCYKDDNVIKEVKRKTRKNLKKRIVHNASWINLKI